MDSENCVACMEGEGKKKILSCGHTIHKECLEKLVSCKCPVCRRDLTNETLPSEILEKMKMNELEYKNEIAEESLRNFLREDNEGAREAYATFRWQMASEIQAARRYLIAAGVPGQYMDHMDIEIPSFIVAQPGDMFNLVVSSFQHMINQEALNTVNAYTDTTGAIDEEKEEDLEEEDLEEEEESDIPEVVVNNITADITADVTTEPDATLSSDEEDFDDEEVFDENKYIVIDDSDEGP